MKKCANCGLESPDEALSCPACSTDAFVTSSPEALGHIISPEEQQFWERMTFRQFAVFCIRLQALWLLFYAATYSTYLLDYLSPSGHFTLYAYLILLRVAMHVALAIICLRYADRIVSWFVKDIIPKTPPNTALPVLRSIIARPPQSYGGWTEGGEPTLTAPSVSDGPDNPKAGGDSTPASGGGGSALDR